MIVTDTILDAQKRPRAGVTVQFIPRDYPAVDTGGILSALPQEVVTDTLGAFSLTLAKGNYVVWTKPVQKDRFLIAVDDSDATANLRTLAVNHEFSRLVYSPELWTPNGGVNYEFDADWLKLRNRITGQYHPIALVGAPGALTIAVGLVAMFPQGNAPRSGSYHRVFNYLDQLRNVTTNFWHSIYLEGLGDAVHWAVDAQDATEIVAGGWYPLLTRNRRLRNGRIEYLNRTTNRFQPVWLDGADDTVHFVFSPPES